MKMELKKRTEQERVDYLVTQYKVGRIYLRELKLQLALIDQPFKLLEKAVMMPKREDKKDLAGFYFDDVKEAINLFNKRAKEITDKRYDFHWLIEEVFGETFTDKR